jgi:hypothetical protein
MKNNIFDRADVLILIDRVAEALRAPLSVSAGKQNDAVDQIYSKADGLRIALHNGFSAFEQSLDLPKYGEAFDHEGREDELRGFLHKFKHDLERLIALAKQDRKKTKSEGGRPPDTRRTVAMARIALWWERENGTRPPRSKESPFMTFATEIFRRANPKDDVDDLSAHVNKVLKLREGGANLETWVG